MKTITLKLEDKQHKKLSEMREDLFSLNRINATSWEDFVIQLAELALDEK